MRDKKGANRKIREKRGALSRRDFLRAGATVSGGLLAGEARAAFTAWEANPNKIPY